jgi:hypothetical protein
MTNSLIRGTVRSIERKNTMAIVHVTTTARQPLDLPLREYQPEHRAYVVVRGNLAHRLLSLEPQQGDTFEAEGSITQNPNPDFGPHSFIEASTFVHAQIPLRGAAAERADLAVKTSTAAAAHDLSRYGTRDEQLNM